MFMSSQRSHCVVSVAILRLGLQDGTELCSVYQKKHLNDSLFPVSICLSGIKLGPLSEEETKVRAMRDCGVDTGSAVELSWDMYCADYRLGRISC